MPEIRRVRLNRNFLRARNNIKSTFIFGPLVVDLDSKSIGRASIVSQYFAIGVENKYENSRE
jgi:hypothetical protein